MTKIFAKLSLAIFLAALLAPCGIMPRHDMSGAVSPTGMMCAGHQAGASHDSADGAAKHDVPCGVDLAAPRSGPGPALLVRQAAPAFDVAAVQESIGIAPPVAYGNPRAGPPGVPVQVYFLAQRLLL